MSSLWDMACQSARYLTYEGYPTTSIMRPVDLSAAGFYYTGPDERVRCFSCHIVVNGWSGVETPFDKHKRMSPQCDFVIENRERMSQASPTTPSESPTTSSLTFCLGSYINDNRGVHLLNQATLRSATPPPPEEDHNFEATARDKHPVYASYIKRIRTYGAFPKHNIINGSTLAENGFYYVGPNDLVRCFSCGIGLKDWKAGDEVWEYHLVHSPLCRILAILERRRAQRELNRVTADLQQARSRQRLSLLEGGGEESRGRRYGEFGGLFSSCGNVNPPSRNDQLLFGQRTPGEPGGILGRISGSGGSSGHPLIRSIFGQNVLYTSPPQRPPPPRPITTQSEQPKAATLLVKRSEHRVEKLPKKQNNDEEPMDTSVTVAGLRRELENYKTYMNCKICMDKPSNISFNPCNHLSACDDCAGHCQKCPICRVWIKSYTKVFIS